MNRALALGLVGVGAVLLLIGINAADSFASEMSEFFSGTPTHESIWMTVIGVILLAVGIGLFGRAKRSA